MSKFNLQKGDKVYIRAPAPRDENTGKVLWIPDAQEKPYEVTKTWNHGVRCKNWGYVHNNCIISKSEE